ncbi:TPR repeat-containing protein YrrB [Candidatus Brocadiaceae bacterium]|nr:TPR repeat-containing protein YrrB [Candidatus Brocadiaceae bacterium]
MKQMYLKKFLPLIIFISVLLYINSLSNTFVYDDVYIITENYLIKSLGNLPKLFQQNYLLLSGELSYRPVVTLTYFIDYAIWNLNPLGYHLTNIILHTVNVFLFYCLITNICKNHTISLFATLFLLSHPILTETVNAVCYREDILASIFFLLAFIFFIKVRMPFSQKENSLQQKNAQLIFYYFLSCASYCLALFSKEMAITLLILLVLFDLLYFRQDSMKALSISPRLIGVARRVLFYGGYIAITGFYLFIRFIVFKNTFKTINVSPTNVVTMTKVVASYIKLLFIPLNLNADYCVPYSRYLSLSFILSALFIASAIIIIIRFHRHNKPITFFNLWFFITLFPVLGIIPIGNIMAERYLYIPVMGFCGVTGCILANYLSQRRGTPIIVGTILLGMQIGVIYRNGVWQDDTTLWSYTYKREPNSARACSNLGNTWFKNQRYEDAIHLYKRSLNFPYSYPFIHYNLAVAYEKVEQIDRAIEAYKASITRHNDNTLAYNNLGTIYHKQGLYDMAIEAYKQALMNNPYFPLSHNNLGNTYERIGDSEKALVEYQEALKIDDTYADAHNNLGAVYLKKGIPDKALVEFQKATQLNPDHRDAHYNLGIAYAGKGLYGEAIHELTLAIKYNPTDYSAHKDLGILYFQYEKDIKKSLYYLHESLRLTHNPVETEKVKEMIDTIKTGQVF